MLKTLLLITLNVLFLAGVSTPYKVSDYVALNTALAANTTEQNDFVAPGIIPDVKWKHLVPCSAMFDEQKQWDRATSCAGASFSKDEIDFLKAYDLLTCYVIK